MIAKFDQKSPGCDDGLLLRRLQRQVCSLSAHVGKAPDLESRVGKTGLRIVRAVQVKLWVGAGWVSEG